jgi:ABC-type antimicrobial peptide transport system permease subunit
VTLGGLIDTDVSVLYDKMQQIPEITETVRCASPLIPARNKGYIKINSWDEQPEKATPVNTRQTYISEQFMAYYDIKIIEGEMLSDRDTEPFVLINESMAKSLGWYKSSGKSFDSEEGNFKVKGVIKNIYSSAPTVPAEPAFYSLDNKLRKGERGAILFKYNKGDWKSCKEKIEAIVKAEYPPYEIPSVCNTEEEYDKFLKSENALLTILSLVSLVCVIVCVFGFVSMVALTCEERRKEIAIRKIHGATIKDILDIFFKEYLTLLIVGALIAFPVGYLVMKGWLENYVIQTEMSAWIYVAILLALIMAIVFCVGRKVYRTSRENPAEAVK